MNNNINTNIQNEVLEKYKKYEIPNKNIGFKNLCYPETYKHQLPQVFVSKFMNPKTNNKGLMLVHRIGAGKTCAGILIGEEWKEKRKVFFIVPASLVNNVYKEFRTGCTQNIYVSSKEKKLLVSLDSTSEEYENLILKINKRIDKYYNIYSYHKFIKLLENNDVSLKNSILIFDEIQNIVSEKGRFYKVLLSSLQKSPPTTRIVIMTATPIFDKPIELALTLNLLKPREIIPVGQKFNDIFIEKVKDNYKLKNKNLLSALMAGLISFSHGAPSIAFPEKKFKLVRCEMSSFQYKSYKTVSGDKINYNFKDILDFPNDFYVGERMISNISYPNKKVNEEGFESLSEYIKNLEDIKKYSHKFYKIIKKVTSSKGPSIVYSDFRSYGGLKPLIKLFEMFGYVNALDASESQKKKKNIKFYGLWSSEEKMNHKEMYKNLYNDPKNKDGSILKVMLISPSGKEGLSLLRTRTMHILSPYWNSSRIEQVIGRGVRFCSHKDLPPEERNVKIYMYLAVYKNSYTIDEHIYDLMLRKKELIDQFYKVIEDSAVDKKLFRNSLKYI